LRVEVEKPKTGGGGLPAPPHPIGEKERRRMKKERGAYAQGVKWEVRKEVKEA
jgi:hypothetical protein